MDNEQKENNCDTDLGSGGVPLLPLMNDSSGKSWQLRAGAGKDSNLYIVNCNSMGKFNPHSNNIYQELPGVLPGGIWSRPAFFGGELYLWAGGPDYPGFSVQERAIVVRSSGGDQ